MATYAEQDQQLHAIVHGRVQGVNFRYYTMRTADAASLVGWVRNLPDGTVEVVAEGPRPQLERLLAFLRKGPASAQVTNVDVQWTPATGEFNGFHVR